VLVLIALLLGACAVVAGIDHTYTEGLTNVDGGTNGDAAVGSADGAVDGGGGATDTTDANTCNKDLTIDPQNCGACGRACGGDAGCAAGQCAPVEIVSAPADRPLLLVSQKLYWTDKSSGTVQECATPGCTTKTPLADINNASGLAVTNTLAVFALGGKGGFDAYEVTGTSSVTCDTGGNNLYQSMTSAPDRAYVATSTGVFQCQDGCTTSGCPLVVAAAPQSPAFLAFAAGALWVPDKLGVRRCVVAGDTCTFADVDGGALVPPPGGGLKGLAADKSGAFLAETFSGGGRVRHVDPMGVVTTVTSGAFSPTDIALDDTHVYLSTAMSIIVVPKSGGSPVTLADGLMGPIAIVAEPNDSDMYVYFADLKGIWRLRK
jgi:hypothetical protein